MPSDTDGSVLDTGNPEGSTPWDQGLDDYRETIDAKAWKGPGDVLKSYVELERAVGADKVVLPSAESNILEWDGWSKLGTPEDAADYAMAAPDGFESYDVELSNDMRAAFHAAKLTPAQAQLVHDKYVERMIGSAESAQTQAADKNEEWTGELKKEYGTAFDERIAAAKRAMREYGGDDLGAILHAAGLGSHPAVVRAFVNAGMQLGHGSQLKDGEATGNFGTSPDAAKDQIATLRANPALYDKSHAEYTVLNERLTRLTQQAFPETAGQP